MKKIKAYLCSKDIHHMKGSVENIGDIQSCKWCGKRRRFLEWVATPHGGLELIFEYIEDGN